MGGREWETGTSWVSQLGWGEGSVQFSRRLLAYSEYITQSVPQYIRQIPQQEPKDRDPEFSSPRLTNTGLEEQYLEHYKRLWYPMRVESESEQKQRNWERVITELFFRISRRSGWFAPSLCMGSCVPSHSAGVWLFVTPWTRACQASLSKGFSRPEAGCHFLL